MLAVWGASFGLILLTFAVFPSSAKLAATVGFLYLPVLAMRRRGEDYRDYGVSFRTLRADLKWSALILAVVLPLFVAGYAAFAEVLPRLPGWASHLLAPYGASPEFHFRLPDRFGEWMVDQLFVVALPEEFFYRGYIQTRLRDAWPQGPTLFGARLGPAFFVTAVLFAVGHLAIFQVWRLGVFFPALIFGWLREKTGSVIGAAFVHAVFNLAMLVLEASVYGQS